MSGPARRPARGSCWCALRSCRNLPGVQHSMQVRCRDLNVIVLVLARAAFRSEHATAVDVFEISIGKLVMSLGILRLFVVDSQIPFAVFGKAVEANEFIFLLCGRPVLAPCIPLVEYKSAFVDKLLGMLICSSIKRHGHGSSPFPVSTHPILHLRPVPACWCCRGLQASQLTKQEAWRNDGNQFTDRLSVSAAN